jgi:hypothetical protein
MMGFPASYDKDSLGNNPSTDEMIFSDIYDDVPFPARKAAYVDLTSLLFALCRDDRITNFWKL